ncbi:hypothetical protein QZH56_03265 [Streptomyces olivoreticuli]|uniref:Integral membrane protein n=1 Tax=Streptomyces blastmyceticus TaxID=68180 RepID=A0ABN0XIK3_9ACTN|nr:hypothetical protein [Streptomyces olivoreticuli]WKK24673.1 hypothetical protein QZH56_03265 [Streptomyces olivoreticuli]
MSNRAKIAVAGVVAGVILLWLQPWVGLLVLVGVPAVAYLLLDPAQRKRLRRASRKQLGR